MQSDPHGGTEQANDEHGAISKVGRVETESFSLQHARDTASNEGSNK